MTVVVLTLTIMINNLISLNPPFLPFSVSKLRNVASLQPAAHTHYTWPQHNIHHPAIRLCFFSWKGVCFRLVCSEHFFFCSCYLCFVIIFLCCHFGILLPFLKFIIQQALQIILTITIYLVRSGFLLSRVHLSQSVCPHPSQVQGSKHELGSLPPHQRESCLHENLRRRRSWCRALCGVHIWSPGRGFRQRSMGSPPPRL